MSQDTATTIHLHGPLAEAFGETIDLFVNSVGEAVRALCIIKKGFKDMVSAEGAAYIVMLGGRSIPVEAVNLSSGNMDIHLIPAVQGAKDEGVQIILGAILIVVATIYGGPQGGVAASKMASALWGGVAVMGWGMVIGGVSRLLSPGPGGVDPKENPENTPNAMFSGPVNTVSQAHPIQLLYGEVPDVGSAVVAAMLDSEEHSGSPGSVSGAGCDPMTSIRLEDGSEKLLSDVTTDDRLAFYGRVNMDVMLGLVEDLYAPVYRVTAGGRSVYVSETSRLPLRSGITKLPSTLTVGDMLMPSLNDPDDGIRVTEVMRFARRMVKRLNFTMELPAGDDLSPQERRTRGIYYSANGLLVEADITPIHIKDPNTDTNV